MSAAAAVVSKIVTISATLISVPIALSFLGTERFGLWMTVTSITALLAFADFGLGNGLVNAIAEANGKNDEQLARRAVSSAFFLFLVIGGLVLLSLGCSFAHVPWHRLFNVESALAMQEAGPATAILVATFVFGLIFGLAQRIQMGYQEGYIDSLWQSAGSVIGLGGVLLTIWLDLGLPWLVLAASGAPVLASLMNSVCEFGRKRTWLVPKWADVDFVTTKRLAASGSLFFVLQITWILGNMSDNLIIAQFLGASSVTTYAVTQKIFLAAQVFSFLSVAMWPAYGEALARSDYNWTRRTLNRSLALSATLGCFAALPLFWFGQDLVRIWVGPEVVPAGSMIAGFATWLLISSYGAALAPFLQSDASLLRQLALFQGLAALMAFGLKLVFIQSWQLSGVIWGAVAGYCLFFLVPAGLLAKKSLQRLAVLAERPLY